MPESVSIDTEKQLVTYLDVLNPFLQPKCSYMQYSRRCNQNSNFETRVEYFDPKSVDNCTSVNNTPATYKYFGLYLNSSIGIKTLWIL